MRRLADGNLWERGQPLTAADERLLQSVRDRARELGYTPAKKDCRESAQIKARFRSWSDVIFACGLPPMNDREQVALRKRRKEKTENEESSHA